MMTSDERNEEGRERRVWGWSAVLLAAAVLLVAAALAVAWLPRGKQRQGEASTGDSSAVATSWAGNETVDEEWRTPEVTLQLRVEGADTARFAAAEGDLLTYKDRVQGFSVGVVLASVDRDRGAVALEVLDREVSGTEPGGVRCGHGTMALGKVVGFRCGDVDLSIAPIGFDEFWSCPRNRSGRAEERCTAVCGSTTGSGPRVALGCAKCCAR